MTPITAVSLLATRTTSQPRRGGSGGKLTGPFSIGRRRATLEAFQAETLHTAIYTDVAISSTRIENRSHKKRSEHQKSRLVFDGTGNICLFYLYAL
jgi:hypothetical protein